MISSEHKKKVLNFFHQHPFVTIGTCHDNIPHTATVFFVVNQDMEGFFVTRTDSKKFHDLKKNPHISLTSSDLKEQITLQIQGLAHEVLFSKEIEVGLLHLFENNESARKWSIPVFKIQNGELSIFKVDFKKIRFGYFKLHQEKNSEYFEEIL